MKGTDQIRAEIHPKDTDEKLPCRAVATLYRHCRETAVCQKPDGLRLDAVGNFISSTVLRAAHLELGGVDLDLAVEDDVLPLDRADVTQQVGVEREVGRRSEP